MESDLFVVSQLESASVVALTLGQSLESGEFDRLNEELLRLVGQEAGGTWILDLSAVAYMGSSALGLLVNLRQRIKQANGRLVLCGLSSRLLGVFKTCCLERLFVIAPTRAAAVKASR